MGRRRAGTRGATVLLCLVLVAGASACSGDDSEGQSPTEEPPSPTAAPAPATELGEIVWAGAVDPASSAPVDRRDAFPRDATVIHAVVRTGPLAADTSLTARWSFNGQPIEGADATVTATGPRDAGWFEFHLEWTGSGLWPVGTLGIDVTASTGESITSEVTIEGT